MARLNISVPERLYQQVQQVPQLNISAICRAAIQEALVREWARIQEVKLQTGLDE